MSKFSLDCVVTAIQTELGEKTQILKRTFDETDCIICSNIYLSTTILTVENGYNICTWKKFAQANFRAGKFTVIEERRFLVVFFPLSDE